MINHGKKNDVRRSRSGVKPAYFIVLMMLLTFPPIYAVSQEEQHQHKQHRHLSYADMKNPVDMTEHSVKEGEKLYDQHCIGCHGKAGRGGIGPRLTEAVRIHGSSDGELFHVITDGVTGTTMKGFKKKVTEEKRWHLVNYIKSLEKNE